jgi:protein kinase C substrate 80K-H
MHSNILSILATVSFALGDGYDSLRGVPKFDLGKYTPDENGNWRCLNNPEIVISFDKVNDDYCDCPDGSDEPGTSACANGRFYCENVGFEPHYIRSFKVNDGVCDYDVCCDGTDELPGVCENKCMEMRKEYDERVRKHNEVVKEGLRIKENILAKSKEMRYTIQASIDKYHEEIGRLQDGIAHWEEKKNEMDQTQELIINNFNIIENDVDAITSKLELSFTKLGSYIEKLQSLEGILKEMTEKYNHNFNDPAVKQAAQEYLNYAASFDDQSDDSYNTNLPTILNELNNEFVKTKEDISIIKAEILNLKFEKAADQTESAASESESHSMLSDFFEILGTICKELVDSFLGVQTRMIPSEDELTQQGHTSHALSNSEIDNMLKQLREKLKDVEKALEDAEEDINKNYGPDDILRSMTDCVITPIGDYNYKLCPTSLLEQVNSEGRGTKIGFFEELRYSEKSGNYQLVFKRGERCWNGPVREAVADLECGKVTEIKLVTEPEKCMYQLKVISPIGCLETDLL